MSTSVNADETAELVNAGKVRGLVQHFDENNKEEIIPESGTRAGSPMNGKFQKNLNFFKNLETRTDSDEKHQSDRCDANRETKSTTRKSNFSLTSSENVNRPEIRILQTDKYLCSDDIFRSVQMTCSILKINEYQPVVNIPSSEDKLISLKEDIKRLVKQIESKRNCAKKAISKPQGYSKLPVSVKTSNTHDGKTLPGNETDRNVTCVSLGLRSKACEETSCSLHAEQSPRVSTEEHRSVQTEDELLTSSTELASGGNVESVSLDLRSEASKETSYGLQTVQSPRISTEEQRPILLEDDLLTSSTEPARGGLSETQDRDVDYNDATTIHEVSSQNETAESKNYQANGSAEMVQTVKMRSMSYDGARTALSRNEFCNCCSQTLPAQRNGRRTTSFCFGSPNDEEDETMTNPKDVQCELGTGGKCRKVSSKNRKNLPVGKKIYNKCMNFRNTCIKGSVKFIYTVNHYLNAKRLEPEGQATQRNDDVFRREEERESLPSLHETRLCDRYSSAETIRRTFEQQYPSVSRYFQQRRHRLRQREASAKESDTSTKAGFNTREKIRTFFRKRPDTALLQTALRKQYSGWRSDLPTDFDLREIPLTYLFDLESTFPGEPPNNRGLSEHLISPGNLCRKILVQGRPRFGKTCLCKCLAYQWSHMKFSISEYKFCFYISLGNLVISTASLAEAILENCQSYFSDRKVTKESVKEILEEENENIVLLLDGYDELSEEGKQKLKGFLKCSDVFNLSTILLATRPDAPVDLLDLFEANVCIAGFSAERLRWHSIVELMDERSLNWLRSLTDNNVQLSELSSLSSGCTFIMKKALDDQQLSSMAYPSIYLILEQIMTYGIKHHSREQTAKNFPSRLKNALMSLGETFLDLLKDGICIFEESLLLGLPGDVLLHLINGVMFYEVRGEGKGNRWGFVSSIWQVFLSTYYLKHICKTWKPTEKKELFKRALCPSGSEGRYVQSSTHVSTEMYFRGSIPDIVISLGNDSNWENAEVKMRHDTLIRF